MIKPGWRRHGRYRTDFLAIGTLLLFWVAAAHAGEKTVLNAPPSEVAPVKSVPDWSFDLTGSYVLGSHFRHLESLGSQAAGYYELEALRRFHIADNWYFRVGFDVSRFDFSRSNAVFPYSLNQVAGEVALEYWHGDDIGVLLKVSPCVYFARD